MKITVETVPHRKQRYPTVGDWQWDSDGNLDVRVSEMHDWRHVAAVAVHEIVEALLARNDGVSEATVDAFDINYENLRPFDDTTEPGDDPACPVVRQHCFATAVERLLIAAFGISWQEYERALPWR